MSAVSFDRVAGAYDAFMGRWTHVFIPALLRAADIAPGQRVLDVATGTAESALRLAAAVSPGGSVLGADISLPMLQAARAKARGQPLRLVAASGQALACRDETFDRVVCQLGLMFFPDPVAGAREARRVLRPGGRFAALVWSVSERVPWSSALSTALLPHFPERRDELFAGGRLGDPERLARVLRDAGLRDVDVTRDSQSMVFESFDAYWAHAESGGIRSGLMLREVPPATAQAIRERVAAALARFATDDRLVLPAETLVAVGTR